MTRHLHAVVDGTRIFYREAGPDILLLHIFRSTRNGDGARDRSRVSGGER